MAIVLDAMGGDHAPEVVVEGAALAAESGLQILLTGPSARISPLLERISSKARANLELVEAPEVVGMSESPAEVLRKKPKSSISIGVRLAKEKGIPFLSAGNTGACMAQALFSFGRLPGIQRPPIASIFPQYGGGRTVVLDVGANVDCHADNLLQFALMGVAYAKAMLGVSNPSVGLLSNGEEAEKGNLLTHEAHKILKASNLNFIGNVEGFDVFGARCDVIVTDGFAGNILLKTAEAAVGVMKRLIQESIPQDTHPDLQMKTLLGKFHMFNPSNPEYSGAPLLGVNGHCYIVHGNADAKTIYGACLNTEKLGQSSLLDLIRQGLESIA